MSIDKKISYVEQDGSLNFIKNSESVTVPKKFKARKEAPTTKLAYITDAEAKMLKKMKKGTPHKGPKGIPSYDSFGSIDASGRDTGRAGSQVSAAERGDFRGFDGSPPVELPPGVTPKGSKAAQDLRSAFIAAGGGQRVNPGFFDSRNVVSPIELARARAFAKTSPFAKKAMRKTRGGGLLGLLSSGGILGNLIRGIGQRLGFGKKFNEPTYDMRQFSNLGLFEPSINPVFDDGSNEDLLSIISDANTVAPRKVNTKGIVTLQPDNILANTGGAFDYLDFDAEDLLGGTPTPKKSKPTINKNIIQDDFIDSLPDDVADNLMAELTDKQKRFIDQKKFSLQEGIISPRSVFETITNPDLGVYDTGVFGIGAQEPTTEKEYNDYLRSIGLTAQV